MLLQDRIKYNTVFKYCRTSCCSCCSKRLFIKQEAIKPSILKINDRKKSQTTRRRINQVRQTILSNYVASALFVVCLIASIYNQKVVCGEQNQQVEIKTQTSLPTVIVRGFLNYRTTVDGTVLLFTPDAGSGSSLASSQNISPTSATAFNFATSSTESAQIQTSQLPSIQQVEPTSVHRQQPLVSSTFFMTPIDHSPENDNFPPVGRHLTSNQPQLLSNQQNSVAADEWRPVQATPPLKSSIQTTFKPNLFNSALDQPPIQTSSSQQQLLASVSTSGSNLSQEQDNRSTPSVQADDILLNEPNLAQQKSLTNNQGSSTGAAEVVVSPINPVSRATRPKRPSLGFNGQGLRSRAGTRSSNNNQAEAQSSNTINGIRRPGLSTTSTTTVAPQASSSQTSGELSNVMGAFQNRLTNASARLRNKLRRPPVGGNSSLVGSMTASAPLLQAAESGEDLVSGSGSSLENHPLTSAVATAPAINQGINPDQSASLSLTSRIGDIFNAGSALIGTSPVVGNDDILAAAASRGESSQTKPGNDQQAQVQPQQGSDTAIEPLSSSSDGQDSEKSSQVTGMKPTSRSGEQKPRDDNKQQPEPQLLSGGLTGTIEPLQQGQLGNMPLSFDNFFQNDQPSGNSESSSEPQPSFRSKEAQTQKSGKNNNDRLNSWLGTHHNKFIPRPSSGNNHGHDQAGQISQQLAANLNQLAPSFSSNLPVSSSAGASVKPTPVSSLVTPSLPAEILKPSVGSIDELSTDPTGSVINRPNTNETSNSIKNEEEIEKDQSSSLQTITKTYSTIMTKSKTRLVPLQVKSSTAIYTITENYVITKMLTAYQTMPNGEFILPETMSTRSPFEMFNEQIAVGDDKSASSNKEPSIAAPSPGFVQGPSTGAVELQPEQPISLDTSPKGPNDWLHDFSNLNNANFNTNSPSQQQQQTNNLAALLEQQAQEANLAGFPSLTGEPLDQLASSLDPAADGTINIPDLNNPLVLAAAIQNPQLAAVILAAQQLQLKQRQNKFNQRQQNVNNNNNNNNNNIQPAIQLQPSYSTSLSTTIKPSIYTVRDTMYTTRLVSFKDGRTVRTRTVSEPGSVIEQVLTTLATEVTPITITIRPTAMFAGALATAAPGGSGNNQLTINNALFATQLANLLARRQQQVVQPSMPGSTTTSLLAAAANLQQQQQQPNFNQVAALQQLIGQQQQQRQQAKQFQPNIQQLLQSMQQPQQSSSLSPSSLSAPNNLAQSASAAGAGAAISPSDKLGVEKKAAQEAAFASPSQTATPVLSAQPIITTLTNLQVKTYTVHNAFKTIYRTITSTQLITSTIFPGATRLPSLG